MEETLDQISPIFPLDLFQISTNLYWVESTGLKKPLKKKYQQPVFSEELFENNFAEFKMAWNIKGLVFDVDIKKSFEESIYPEVRKGDSIELFIDTRDLKSAGFPTRFCHHFIILSKPVEGIEAEEVTSFRTEDRHELCDPTNIEIIREFKKNRYSLKIFIPSECLNGYDPLSFDRLGFTYRINRSKKDPQHFVVSSKYWSIENQPSLWSSMKMRKE